MLEYCAAMGAGTAEFRSSCNPDKALRLWTTVQSSFCQYFLLRAETAQGLAGQCGPL